MIIINQYVDIGHSPVTKNVLLWAFIKNRFVTAKASVHITHCSWFMNMPDFSYDNLPASGRIDPDNLLISLHAKPMPSHNVDRAIERVSAIFVKQYPDCTLHSFRGSQHNVERLS